MMRWMWWNAAISKIVKTPKAPTRIAALHQWWGRNVFERVGVGGEVEQYRQHPRGSGIPTAQPVATNRAS